jgi:hypothetical protein
MAGSADAMRGEGMHRMDTRGIQRPNNSQGEENADHADAAKHPNASSRIAEWQPTQSLHRRTSNEKGVNEVEKRANTFSLGFSPSFGSFPDIVTELVKNPYAIAPPPSQSLDLYRRRFTVS